MSSRRVTTSTTRGQPLRCTARTVRRASSSTSSATMTATAAMSTSSTTHSSGRPRSWLAMPACEIGSAAWTKTATRSPMLGLLGSGPPGERRPPETAPSHRGVTGQSTGTQRATEPAPEGASAAATAAPAVARTVRDPWVPAPSSPPVPSASSPAPRRSAPSRSATPARSSTSSASASSATPPPGPRSSPTCCRCCPAPRAPPRSVSGHPARPTIAARTVPFGLRAASREDPDGSTVEEGTVEVTPFTDTFAEIIPRTARGRISADLRPRLRQPGQHQGQRRHVGRRPQQRPDLRIRHRPAWWPNPTPPPSPR